MMSINDKSIVILGGKGMLGTDIQKSFRQKNFDIKVLDLPEFDITNHIQLKEAVTDSQIIINCAAYTNVDGAESEGELAYKINAEAVGQLGNIAKEMNKWILHISTDFVFDGCLDRAYVENDKTNPLNTYGKTKLAGEQLLIQSGCKYCVLRIEWTYGKAGNNFVSKIVEYARKNKMLKVVDDQIGSPTATVEVAAVVCKMLEKKPEGIFHFASSGYVSRYKMAEFVFDKLSMDNNLMPCKTKDFQTPAKRPLNSRFNCSKIVDLLGIKIEHWEGPLEIYLRKL
jgi:dTDP-4-dehydrorhamnose reductase